MPAFRQLSVYGPFTTTERNALASVPTYTIIFNSTTAQFEFWDGANWFGVLGDNPTISGGLIVSGSLTVLGQLNQIVDAIFSADVTLEGGRLRLIQGADVASTTDTLGSDGNVFEITGTSSNISAITTTGWQNGSVIHLLFTSTPLILHNTAGGGGTAVMLLAGGVNFQAAAGDRLTLCLSEIGGTQAWREVSRTLVAATQTYTQTYSTADRTHANPTATALTDSSGGTPDQTVASVVDPADTPITADALRDDLVTNTIPVIRDNFAELTDEVNKLIADVADAKQLINALVDDLQAKRIVA